MPDADVLALLAVITVAYTCAGALGFGANVLSVALGAQLLPVEQILPAILPTTLALSGWIAWRQRRHIATAVLTREVLPWALLGFPVGLFVFQTTDTVALQRLLGVVVAGLGLVELLRATPNKAEPRRPL
ncbi:MAG: putative membrane protein YfcA, partial [Pseudohongiellaceae bacterium]